MSDKSIDKKYGSSDITNNVRVLYILSFDLSLSNISL